MYTISTLEITLRLLAAVFVGGVIGYEREENRQAAGLRTNIIVSVSACLITLIQLEIGYYSLNLAIANPDIASSITVDFTRIIAQIVSGIGFLGAGTILITKRDTVTGLTSAATIWTVAGLGIAVGMGYYFLSVIGCLILYIVLHIIKKIRTSIGGLHVEVHYRHQDLKKVIELFLSE
ncbi:MAG: MgtC/SapB family protein, partial [Trichococcus flocculiformis]